MVLPSTNTNVENSVGTSEEFQIKADEKLFRLLSDNVYADKISAGIRELACNAYDAHVEVGSTQKFQVTLPSEDKPEFRVRDFGTGLSPSQMSMYTTYGMSSKEDSNAYIGAFGIGAKAPFAYTDIFNVTSYQNGKAYFYTMYIENGTPKKTLLAETPTTEPNGLEVFYAVKPEDISTFLNKALRILTWLKESVEVLNAPSWWIHDFTNTDTNWQPAPYLGQNFAELGLKVSDRSWSELKVVQGNVLYSISGEECREAFSEYIDKQESSYKVKVDLENTKDIGFEGIIRVPNGTFMPQPSRERLSFTPETKSKLGSILYFVYQEKIVNYIRNLFRNAQNSYIKLYQGWTASSDIIRENTKFKNLFFKGYDGVPFKKWQNRIIKNLRALKISSNQEQLYIVNLRETLNSLVFSGRCPLFRYSESKTLSLEKKCRIIETTESLTERAYNGIVAFIFFDDTIANITESDKAQLQKIEDLPKSSPETQERWSTVAVESSTGKKTKRNEVLTVFNMEYGAVERTKLEVKVSPDNIFMTWLPAEKAYEFTFNGTHYNIDYVADRRAFSALYKFIGQSYLKKKGDEIGKDLYGSPKIVLLPKDHPLQVLYTPFEEVVAEGVKYYLDSYEESLGWVINYSDRKFKGFVQLLMHTEILKDLNYPQEIIKKYESWKNDGYTTSRSPDTLKDLRHITLDNTYKAKLEQIQKSIKSEARVLSIWNDIIEPMRDKFPLVEFIRYGYDVDEPVAIDLVTYITDKIQKEKENN